MDRIVALHDVLTNKCLNIYIVNIIMSYIPSILCNCGEDLPMCGCCTQPSMRCSNNCDLRHNIPESNFNTTNCSRCKKQLCYNCYITSNQIRSGYSVYISKINYQWYCCICPLCLTTTNTPKCGGCGLYGVKYQVCNVHNIKICITCADKSNHSFDTISPECTC